MNVQPKELLRALKILRPVVSPNPVISVLGNVKIINDEVIGTNLNVSIKEKIKVDGEGIYLFPLTELINICNVSSETLTLDDDKITSGNDRYKLGHPNDIGVFPGFEHDIIGATATVHAEIIQSILRSVRFLHKEPMLPIGNVNIQLVDGLFIVTATNGMALYRNSFKIESESDGTLFNVMLPPDFVKCLAGVSGACEITISESKISVTNGSTCVIGTLSEGRYPDCSVVFRKRETDLICLDRFELAEALTKVSSIYSALPLCKMLFSDKNQIGFTLEDYGPGYEVSTSITNKHNVKTEEVTVNAHFFVELLNTLPPNVTEVAVQIEAKDKHILITSDQTDIKLITQPLM